MPWYIRKSLSRGPIRLNLSKRGLGASFGVKGLRIGVGPKGTYIHGGRGGLYYRQYLNSKVPAVPAPSLQQQQWPSEQSSSESLEFAGVPATDDDVAAAINQRLQEFRWSRAVLAGAFALPLLLLFARLYILAGLAFIGLIVWSLWLSDREGKRRCVNLTYNLPELVGKYYEAFVHAFELGAQCSAIWRVTSQTAAYAKYAAGADRTVERSITAITFNNAALKANLTIPWLWVAGGKLALLPDRLLFFGPAGVMSMSYKDVRLLASLMNFRENGPVPPDSTNVGVSWQFVNKSGGPDRRFANNRQLPIQRYSDLQFTHPQLTFRLEFSRVDIADVLKKALEGLAVADASATWNVGVTGSQHDAPEPTPDQPAS